ncbi:hypothetical protein GFL57_03335 [Rhizobium leguminosarum bv. viciae]|nr:hypothetical protein [Rhizobium leguminosarum bv. viciae]
MFKQSAVMSVVVALSIIAIIVYFAGGSLSIEQKQMFFWDMAIKALGGFAALAGAWLAFSKYLHEKAIENQAAMIEAKKPFSAKRQEVYYDLVSTTSRIANRGKDDPIRKTAEENFWWLFWGGVPMVADLEVGGAVNRFENVLSFHPHDGEQLRNGSMDIAKACRNSLGFVDMAGVDFANSPNRQDSAPRSES